MVVKVNSFEAGPAGNNFTTAVSGGANGDAFDLVNAGTSFQYSATQKMHGALSAVYSAGGADSTGHELRWTGLSSAEVAARGYFFFSSFDNAASVRTIAFYNTAEQTIADLVLRSSVDGSLTARNATSEIAASNQTALSINTWYRIEMIVTVGPGVGDDRIRIAYYVGDSTTAVGSWDSGATLTFTNSGNVDRVYFGKTAITAWTGPHYIDDVAIDTVPSGFIGPYELQLATPVVTVDSTTDPSTVGGTDGEIVVSWPAVSGAATYDAGIADGHDQTSGFTIDSAAATSPYTFSGLDAGEYTVAIRAQP